MPCVPRGSYIPGTTFDLMFPSLPPEQMQNVHEEWMKANARHEASRERIRKADRIAGPVFWVVFILSQAAAVWFAWMVAIR